VSIVIVADGEASVVAESIEALARTMYRPLEVVIAAEPGPNAAPRTGRSSIPIVVVRVAAADDRGSMIDAAVAAAGGELICVLDPAVEPLLPDWLGHLVETVEAGAAAAGPVIVRAPGHGLVPAAQRSRDLSVLSAGVDFARFDGAIAPRHIGFGAPYRWAPSSPTRTVPGLSVAGLLVRRSALTDAGGWARGFVEAGLSTGGEPHADADLAIRLRAAGGRLVCDHRAVAMCRVDESDVAPAVGPPKGDVRARWDTAGDRATFLDRWGPRLAREVYLDVLGGRHEWSVDPLHIRGVGMARLAATPATTGDPRITYAAAGAGTDPATGGADVLLVGDLGFDIREAPTGQIRVAWVTDTAPRHLDEFDLVIAATARDRERVEGGTAKRIVVADLAAPGGIDRLGELIRDWVEARRIGIRIGPSTWRTAHAWGDYHFARSLQRYLERAGLPTRVRLIRDWSSAAAARDDATIHLFGNRLAHNRPSQVNVLWQISHPDLATIEQYDGFDHVFVASDPFAATMAERSHVPVEALHQATDPERFYPDPLGEHHDLLFVANYRPDRPVLDWLLPTGHDLAVYGKDWDRHGLEPRYHRGQHIPNPELRVAYSAASIVLNDTWADMRAAGFIPNRVYDALACGAFVVSDDVVGIVDEFDGAVAIYRDPAELRAMVDRFLAYPAARRAMAERGRAAVLERHTFERRTASILAAIGPRLAERPGRISEAGPSPADREPPAGR
jgi:GT2 family glycosyltransferase